VKKLKQAADAGVQMDLIVRTTHCMKPHENIRAISILDRFLEHQRAYVFGRDDDQRVFLSSSDLMERNMDWRVEVAFPVYDAAVRQIVLDILAIQLMDNAKARELNELQSNPYVEGARGTIRSQAAIHDYFLGLAAGRRIMPEPEREPIVLGNVS
jgi:polyphosphate kinase